ncbi:uncharacterized protein (DUF1501 family) [Rhodopirellula rubra]|uniref:Uncharacterized protein (DUF1501 family) n=1 Tax=Aporhodopirellula rubra TaxID=980271 RepID=A0A7W5E2G3_9BACT|nr:DUF1501 domain-containing protein [Aporhodopirellula rubra]MBB3208082.1 uncharacterized protein (DUF1501 family) [Aporhodopirellula rubra]
MMNFHEDPSAPESIVRRDFLRRLSAAGAAALASGAPRLLANGSLGEIEHPRPKADACILLWMAGGMAAPDTFDPKRYHPFEKGLPVKEMLSTFPAIDTAVDDIKICQGLENIASVMDRGTLIRSHVQPDLGSILHSRHQYQWHTGYVPPQTVAAPHIGAWMARVLGAPNEVMPAFINIGQRLEGIGESEELKAFTTAGFFGSEFGPMNLPYPDQAAVSVRPPKGMESQRFANRNRLFRKLVDASPDRDRMSDYQQESMLRSMDAAYRLLSSKDREAFDITLEPKESFEKYDTGRFGQGCLLARRLVESGARFVEVTTEYVPFLHWDTHNDGHTTTTRMHQEIDRPIAQLIRDLEDRKLLDRTLVIVASEFSRDALMEGKPGSNANDQAREKVDALGEMKHYGLHRHFTGGSSVLMFGGGIKKGQLYGSTSPERPLVAIENPVSIEDLHATIMTAMGISPRMGYEIEGRPFYVTEDGNGRSVDALFA